MTSVREWDFQNLIKLTTENLTKYRYTEMRKKMQKNINISNFERIAKNVIII